MDFLPVSKPLQPASRFNEWLYEAICPWLKGRVLEVNSGPDTISSIFLQRERKVHLNSSDSEIRHYLSSKYKGKDVIRSVSQLDFRRPDFEEAYSEKHRVFDTILLLNSTQNGGIDQVTVSHAKLLLQPRGRLIILAPARIAIFDGIDDNQEEYKKYNRKEVHSLISDDMEMLMTKYFILQPSSSYPQVGLSVLAIARKIT